MATKQIRFTKATIDGLQPPAKGRDVYRDTENRYLHLYVSPGAKTFYLIRKVDGKVRFISLGRHPEFTISQARNLCSEIGGALSRGDDTKNNPDKITFGELFDKYLTGHAKKQNRTWKEDKKNFDRYLSSWKRKRAADIDARSMNRLHVKLGETRGHYTANRMLSLVKTVFNYAAKIEGVALVNPAIGVAPYTETSRDRYLNSEELKRLFDALDDDQTPELWRDFFSMCLWTGARRGNVQAMRWAHIDLAAGTWKIPGNEFKNGDPFTCTLCADARAILQRRQAMAEDSPFVFPSPTAKSGHVEQPKKAWAGVLNRAGLQDVRIHDLRRTLGSWQAAAGSSLAIIGKSLGHKTQTATAIYARLDLDPVRASVDAATAAMRLAIDGKK